ncbi:MAG: (Fe-S)-binding protein [Nitrospirae bacterium]|nr:MAG: (Fe-S)-binding protein [Nitrospirota bacterium]
MDERRLLSERLALCALCGRCKKDCPTYLKEQNEARSPRGRLLLLYETARGRAEIDQSIVDRLYSCLLCGACDGVCPSGVDTLGALIRGRSFLRGYDKRAVLLRKALSIGVKRPLLSFRLFSTFKELLGRFLVKKGLIHEGLDLDMPPLQRIGSVFEPLTGKKRGRVVLFTGCAVRYLYPYLGQSFISVMNSLGFEVVVQKKEYCCGAPLLSLGLLKETEELARKNLESFRSLKADGVVSLCPTCVTVSTTLYRRLFGDSLEMVLFDDFIKEYSLPGQGVDTEVFYHSACHRRFAGGDETTVQLIERQGAMVKGRSSGCCGHGGGYSFRHPDRAGLILKERREEFVEADADVVVTSCPGCMFQLSKAVEHERVIHTVELIEEAIQERKAED